MKLNGIEHCVLDTIKGFLPSQFVSSSL